MAQGISPSGASGERPGIFSVARDLLKELAEFARGPKIETRAASPPDGFDRYDQRLADLHAFVETVANALVIRYPGEDPEVRDPDWGVRRLKTLANAHEGRDPWFRDELTPGQAYWGTLETMETADVVAALRAAADRIMDESIANWAKEERS
jgi:hypothetical protein